MTTIDVDTTLKGRNEDNMIVLKYGISIVF